MKELLFLFSFYMGNEVPGSSWATQPKFGCCGLVQLRGREKFKQNSLFKCFKKKYLTAYHEILVEIRYLPNFH